MTLQPLRENIGLATIIVTLCGGCALSAGSRDPSIQDPYELIEAAQAPQTANPALKKTPGLTVHIDPDTGQVLANPPPASAKQEIHQPLLQSTPAPAPQFLELPSPTPGGGVMVNLNRQFHTPLVGTIDADGKIRFEHRPGMPVQTQAK